MDCYVQCENAHRTAAEKNEVRLEYSFKLVSHGFNFTLVVTLSIMHNCSTLTEVLHLQHLAN